MEITWVVGKEVIAVSGITRAMAPSFKQVFPGGRWDPSSKTWLIRMSAQALEKLDIYQHKAGSLPRKAHDLDERELAYEEIQRLQTALDTLLEETEEALAKSKRLDELSAIYENLFLTQGEVGSELRKVVREANKKAAAQKKIVDPLLSIVGADKAIGEMIEHRRSFGSDRTKAAYDSARLQLRDCHQVLVSTYSLDLATLIELAELEWDEAAEKSKRPEVVARSLYVNVRCSTPPHTVH